MSVRLAVIGGSGLYELDLLEGATGREGPTPYGAPSARVVVGRIRRAGGAVLAAPPKRNKAAVRGRAVYAQTRGPRLETKAEIRLLADYADVVGMTMASEATLAAEADLGYACLCAVDNYAHGVAAKVLSYEEIMKRARRNAKKVEAILPNILRS